jgi:hypothetical protein
MRAFGTAIVVVGLMGVLVGCWRGQTPIPPGAQQVHIVVTESEVRLDRATVRAGDAYLVLDTPGSTVAFVQRKTTAEEAPGPLSDADLPRLTRGDTEGTAIESFSDTGCSAAQRAEDRGQMGYCGNLFKVVLSAGKYAFLTAPSDGGSPGLVPPRSMAVLQVLP